MSGAGGLSDYQALLERNLDWVAAADSKVPAIMALDTAMLGVLVALLPSADQWSVLPAIVTAISALLLVASLIFLATAVFPRLDGPKESLIYFQAVVSGQLNPPTLQLINTQ